MSGRLAGSVCVFRADLGTDPGAPGHGGERIHEQCEDPLGQDRFRGMSEVIRLKAHGPFHAHELSRQPSRGPKLRIGLICGRDNEYVCKN